MRRESQVRLWALNFASNDSHKTPFLLQHPLAHHRSKHQSGWLESCSRRRIEAPPKEQRVRVRLHPPAAFARAFSTTPQLLSRDRFEMNLTPLVQDHFSFIAGLPDSVDVSIRNYTSSSALFKKLQMETQSEPCPQMF